MDGFIDHEKLKALGEKVRTLYLELGMTVVQQQHQMDEEGNMVMFTVALVRDTAFEQLSQDLDVRKTFAKQMAAEHQRKLDQQAEAIARAAEAGTMMRILTGQQALVECSHERMHEGLCLDCGEEVDEH